MLCIQWAFRHYCFCEIRLKYLEETTVLWNYLTQCNVKLDFIRMLNVTWSCFKLQITPNQVQLERIKYIEFTNSLLTFFITFSVYMTIFKLFCSTEFTFKISKFYNKSQNKLYNNYHSNKSHGSLSVRGDNSHFSLI